jgi:hypothetical protein
MGLQGAFYTNAASSITKAWTAKSGFTVFFRARILVRTAAYLQFFSLDNNGSSYVQIGHNGVDGAPFTNQIVYASDATSTVLNDPLTGWCAYALRFDSATVVTLLQQRPTDLAPTSFTLTNSNNTPSAMFFGTSGYGEQSNSEIADIMIWGSLLPAALMAAQCLQREPVTRRDLGAWLPQGERVASPVNRVRGGPSYGDFTLTGTGLWVPKGAPALEEQRQRRLFEFRFDATSGTSDIAAAPTAGASITAAPLTARGNLGASLSAGASAAGGLAGGGGIGASLACSATIAAALGARANRSASLTASASASAVISDGSVEPINGVVFGDSFAEPGAAGLDPSEALAARLQHYRSQDTWVSEGVGLRHLEDLIDDFEADVHDAHFDATPGARNVVVIISGNHGNLQDTAQTAAQVAQLEQDLVDLIHTFGWEVVVTPCPGTSEYNNPSNTPYTRPKRITFNGIMRDGGSGFPKWLGADRFWDVETIAGFGSNDPNPDPPPGVSVLLSDGIHPSATGHDLIAQLGDDDLNSSPLGASLSASASVTGALIGRRAAAGSLSAGASASAAVAAFGLLAAACSGGAAASGGVAGYSPLAAATTAGATASGAVTGRTALAASLAASGTAAGTLGGRGALGANCTAGAATTAGLSGRGNLGASCSSSAAAAGALGALASLGAGLSAGGALTATFGAAGSTAASCTAGASLTGALFVYVPLAASVAGGATCAGELTQRRALTASLGAGAACSSSLTAWGNIGANVAAGASASGQMVAGAVQSSLSAGASCAGALGALASTTASLNAGAALDAAIIGRTACAASLAAGSTCAGELSSNASLQASLGAGGVVDAPLGAVAHMGAALGGGADCSAALDPYTTASLFCGASLTGVLLNAVAFVPASSPGRKIAAGPYNPRRRTV